MKRKATTPSPHDRQRDQLITCIKASTLDGTTKTLLLRMAHHPTRDAIDNTDRAFDAAMDQAEREAGHN